MATPEQNEEAVNELQDKLDQLPELIMAEVLKRVAERTPVDTGLAQESYKIEQVDDKNWALTNEQPYVVFLEFGTEHIPPVAMVRTTVTELPAITEEAKNKLGL